MDPTMKYAVVTTFHAAGYQKYASKMIDTFLQNWPKEVDLIICAEDCKPVTRRSNTRVYDLLALSSNLRVFIERHRNNPKAHGEAGPESYHPKKKFKWDAVRFCYKVYAQALCADKIDSGWMIWIDADTVTHNPITIENLEKLCPNDAMISYLGRGENYHSECGWVAYNLDHPQTVLMKKFLLNLPIHIHLI